MILISACLCGIDCRYDGGSKLDEKATNLFKSGKAILVCPEQLGGMSTPRLSHEIIDGTGKDVLEGNAKVLSREGTDSTNEFIKGAEETLKIAKGCGAKIAILKARSPSCGFGTIYNGSFSGEKISGNGVAAELLFKNGIRVITEEDYEFIEQLNYEI